MTMQMCQGNDMQEKSMAMKWRKSREEKEGEGMTVRKEKKWKRKRRTRRKQMERMTVREDGEKVRASKNHEEGGVIRRSWQNANVKKSGTK